MCHKLLSMEHQKNKKIHSFKVPTNHDGKNFRHRATSNAWIFAFISWSYKRLSLRFRLPLFFLSLVRVLLRFF